MMLHLHTVDGTAFYIPITSIEVVIVEGEFAEIYTRNSQENFFKVKHKVFLEELQRVNRMEQFRA